jgi:hypothetical protein
MAQIQEQLYDVFVKNMGTLIKFLPITDKAYDWLMDNTHAEDHMWFGRALMVEHRYAFDIIRGMADDGLHLTGDEVIGMKQYLRQRSDVPV